MQKMGLLLKVRQFQYFSSHYLLVMMCSPDLVTPIIKTIYVYHFFQNQVLSYIQFIIFFRYLTPYRKEIVQLILGMLTVSLLQLITPFLTQSMVDTGIRDSNLSFITLILIAQLVIFVARLSVDFIRSWPMLHVNTRINISLISDFLAKLMRLPLRFFDSKKVGDIMQRIGCHRRIEAFMTG